MITRRGQDQPTAPPVMNDTELTASKKRVLSESMLSPQLKDSNYATFQCDVSQTSDEVDGTPKQTRVTSSQGSQGLRRSVGLLNLSIETSPRLSSSSKIALLKNRVSNQDIDNANLDVENWSPFKDPSTPSVKTSHALKRPASNSSASMSPFISDSQRPLLFSSSKNNAAAEENRTSLHMKFNKLRKMVSLDKVPNDFDSPFDNDVHPLPNPSIHFQVSNKENILESPSNSPSRPARQKLKLDKSYPLTANRSILNLKNSEMNSSAIDDGECSTPNSYKFVKPLQTAFMSSGLLSKKNRTLSESFHPPETPCKKPIQLNIQTAQKQALPSSNLANVITASSPHDDKCTPRLPDETPNANAIRNSSHSTPYDTHSPSNENLPRSARALNTNELRDCILRFTSDFDDSTESIFEDDKDEHDPSTPTRLRTAKAVLNKNLKLNLCGIANNTSTDGSSTPKTPIDFTADTSGDLSNVSSIGGNASTYIPPTATTVDEHLTSKFENVQLVGNGEFSNVYEITFQTVKYAVKRIKTPLLGPKRRKRIFEEVELLKTLQENEPQDDEGKEYVINFINDWEHSDHLYIMMEFCENGTLDRFLEDSGKLSKLDEWRIWKILVEVAMGLKYIHSCNILHLDLKPANIFITFDGTLKIGDFGMAAKYPVLKGFEREGDREYIAPEIIAKQQYDKPADIFSFGLIMVEIAANIILPEYGVHWHKLRSGDLSDAGRLSSGELNVNLYNDSLTSKNSNSTYSSMLNNTAITGSSYSSVYDGHSKRLPPWTPKFLIDGKGALDKLVQWMINPTPENRPSAADVLNTMECQFVEMRRKAGAVIFEGEYGPPPDLEEESTMSQDVKSLNVGGGSAVTLSIPSDIMDQDEW